MSDTEKNLNDLMGKYFPDDNLMEKYFPDADPQAESVSAPVSAADAEAENEEISVSDDSGTETDEGTEIVTDVLEEDSSEAENADVSIAGEMEWETLEITETVSEMFDKKGISKIESVVSHGNSGVCEDLEENVGNDLEMEKEAEISRNAKTEMKENTETGAKKIGNAPSPDDSDEFGDEDFNESFMKKFLKGIIPWKGDSVGEIIRKIIFIAASAVFIGAGCMLASTLVQSRQAVEQKEKDKEIIVTTAATTIDESGNVVTVAPTEEQEAEHRFNVSEYYKGINEDYIGYLELSGCDIAEPIVKGEDNEYYLTHAIHGGTNKAGTVFMDYRCTFTDDYISPNIVFYGHNQEDGTMFGNLKRYKQDAEFYGENPIVRFSTAEKTYEYIIYGFFVTNALEKQDSNGEVFHYQDYIETLSDENTFNWYLDMVNERNQIVPPVDVEFGDKLLCLSTCSNEFSNSRFVIFARMLRDDESAEDYDFSRTYLNPYARGVDWEAIMSGETSANDEELLDSEDEEDGDEIVGNGFLETAVHTARRPAKTESETETGSEETAVPDEENESETEETTSKKKKKKKTETEETTQENGSDTSGLEEVTRKKPKKSVTSSVSDGTADSAETSESQNADASETTAPNGETSPDGETSSGDVPAETAPPENAEDGSSETVTAG